MKNASSHAGKLLRELFPEQTKSPGSILLWTLVYLLDAAAVFWAASRMGLEITGLPHRQMTAAVGILLAIALGIFWAEAAFYSRLLAKYRTTLE